MPSRKAAQRRRASAATAAARASGSAAASSGTRRLAAGASSGLQASEPFLNSGKTASELVQARLAVARCSGSGRGPWRGGGGGLEGMGHSRLHQGEPPDELAGQLRVAGQSRRLVLPEVQVAARQGLDIRRLSHGATITKPRILRRNIRWPVSLPAATQVLLCFTE